MITPTELRQLADIIENDTRYGTRARLVTAAILRGIAARTERDAR